MTADDRKREVGRRAAELVADGTIVGLGTGSTAAHFVERLGERVREGLRVRGVPTSERTARQAESCGIPLATLDECPRLDLAVDGADQVDPRADLIKGLGGALVREKRVARASREFVVIVDSAKMVPVLGVGCPVPVEVDPDAWKRVRTRLAELGAQAQLRQRGQDPWVTDNGNLILDAEFGALADPADLERRLNGIPGVLDNGLFVGLATRVLIAEPHGVREWVVPRSRTPSARG
ncbi:MAG: ribose-5-phosphate isomerase RpiA [bacterium]